MNLTKMEVIYLYIVYCSSCSDFSILFLCRFVGAIVAADSAAAANEIN